MSLKRKRARQGCHPNLAPTPNKSTISKESIAMLPKNSGVSKATRKNCVSTKQSPWITHRDNSVFGLEMRIAEEANYSNIPEPNPLFVWLNENNLNSDLFKALDKLCPLHPVVSYNGNTSLWLSPPPSGSGNTVGIIIGKDISGQLRIIGTNFMNNPDRRFTCKPSKNIFEDFDAIFNSPLSIYNLIENEINSRMTSEVVAISKIIEREAFKYRTMPIYILLIDGDKSYFAIDTAVVSGDYPSDMSYEFAGEVV